MAINISGKFKPNGDFPLVDAEDVAMPDGTRLSDNNLGTYKIVEGTTVIKPCNYYVFDEVDSLDITLAETDDNVAYEYCFEFIPTDSFTTLTITPEPRWASPVQFIPGKTHQVSILRGIGVMVCA